MKKMPNIFILFISFVASFAIWIFVMNKLKPYITQTLNIPIEIKLESDETIETLGRVYTIEDEKYIKFTYRVRNDNANLISSSNIKAYIEVSNLSQTSGYLQVHVDYTDDNINDLIKDVNFYPQIVSVVSSDLDTRHYNVSPHFLGKLSNQASIGSYIINPNSISVSGKKEDLDRISEVVVDVVLDGHNDSFSGKEKIKLFSHDKREVKLNENMIISVEEVDYSILVYISKLITLVPMTEGEVQNGCKLENVSVTPNTILISGPKYFIDAINTLELPNVNVQGVTESKEVGSFYIKDILPAGINYIGTDDELKVSVEVSGKPNIIIAPKVMEEE